jgi:hypothetical protein
MLRGPQAFEVGMADAMVEPADFLEESLRCAAPPACSMVRSRCGGLRSRRPARQTGTPRWPQPGSPPTGSCTAPGPSPTALDLVAAAKDRTQDAGFAAGWPFHPGGITLYLDRTGIAEKVTGSRFR